MTDGAFCVTCGTERIGSYCHVCGEKVLGPAELRVGTFVRRATGAAFDVDSRLWRTFRLLLFRPGELTAEFVRGRRQPYMHPFQVFLLANVIFFLALEWVGGFNTFTTKLEHHLAAPLYGAAAHELVAQHGAPGTEAAAEYARRFDEATPAYAHSMIILMVPILATGIALLFLRRREPFVKHLVLALLFMAFLLLLITVLPFAITPLIAALPDSSPLLTSEAPVIILMVGLFVWYFALAFRAAYDDGPRMAVARAVGATAMLIPALLIYRAVLFFTVYLALD